MRKILLVDIMAGKPSLYRTVPLALLKLSTFYKNNGDDVKCCTPGTIPASFEPDIICFSCIFIFKIGLELGYIKGFIKKFPKAKIRVGGISPTLKADIFRKHLGDNIEICKGIDDEIENLTPDWSLVPMAASYGFTSRGCNRKCPWCVVPIVEGKVKLVDGWERQIGPQKLFKAYDNNILATSPEWMESVMAEIKKQKKKIDFNQGMDCRLFAKHEGFHRIFKEYEHSFEIIRFGYDSNNLKTHVMDTVRIMKQELKIHKQFTWYMLYGNGETVEDFWEKLETIFQYRGHSIKPMRFKDLETGKYRCHGWCDHFANYMTFVGGMTGLIQHNMHRYGLFGRDVEEFKRLIFMIGKNLHRIKRAFPKKDFQIKPKHYDFIRGVAEGKIKTLEGIEY